jgi:hypothetical protein
VTRRAAAPRRRLAVLVALLVPVVAAPACSDDHQAFCDRLRDTWQLTDLRDAIDRDDRQTISEQLLALKDLADDAPAAIAVDLHVIVDTLTDTVRAVTNVTSPGGEKMPPDLDQLNESLANVAENSQRVVQYADRDCNLTLNA